MTEDDNNLLRRGEKLAKQLLEVGINGGGPLPSAEQVFVDAEMIPPIAEA